MLDSMRGSTRCALLIHRRAQVPQRHHVSTNSWSTSCGASVKTAPINIKLEGYSTDHQIPRLPKPKDDLIDESISLVSISDSDTCELLVPVSPPWLFACWSTEVERAHRFSASRATAQTCTSCLTRPYFHKSTFISI